MYDKTVRRRRIVLGLLVASSLILLTAYFGESSGGGLHAVQRGVLEVVSPIQEGASRALKPVRDLFGWAGDTLRAKGDVQDLRAERDRLRRRAVAGVTATRENRQLKAMLDVNAVAGLAAARPVVARVTAQDPSVWWSQIVLNKGSRDGVRVGHPVINGQGLIGRVSFVAPGSAVVTLLSDHTIKVPARVAESGVTGVVEVEAGRPTDLILSFTNRTDRVDPGQTVVTAGTRSRRYPGLYPPNVPIGEVTRIDEATTDDQKPHVRPFAEMRRLELVQVLTRPNGPPAAP